MRGVCRHAGQSRGAAFGARVHGSPMGAGPSSAGACGCRGCESLGEGRGGEGGGDREGRRPAGGRRGGRRGGSTRSRMLQGASSGAGVQLSRRVHCHQSATGGGAAAIHGAGRGGAKKGGRSQGGQRGAGVPCGNQRGALRRFRGALRRVPCGDSAMPCVGCLAAIQRCLAATQVGALRPAYLSTCVRGAFSNYSCHSLDICQLSSEPARGPQPHTVVAGQQPVAAAAHAQVRQSPGSCLRDWRTRRARFPGRRPAGRSPCLSQRPGALRHGAPVAAGESPGDSIRSGARWACLGQAAASQHYC